MANEATTIEEQRLAGLNKARFRDKSKAGMLMSGGRFAISVATGGIGRAANKEINRRISGKVAGAGERAAKFFKKKKGVEGAEDGKATDKTKDDKDVASTHKLSGIGFWLIFSLSVANEVADIFFNFTLIFSAITLITGLTISFIIGFYLFYQGVSPTTKKLVLWIVSMLIEAVPLLNVLPTYPFSLLIMKWMENNAFIKKHAQLAKVRGASSLV